MNCLAHLLNLVVKLVFGNSQITPLLSKCRTLVGTFKHSTTMSAKLTEVIKAGNIIENPIVSDVEPEILFLDEENEQAVSQQSHEFELLDEAAVVVRKNNLKTKLVQDMVTRWNSTLAMLTRLVEFSPFIRYVFSNFLLKVLGKN